VAGFVLGQEELGVEPLAHEAALHVGEARDHGVDRAHGDVFPEFLERQHRADTTPARDGCNVRHIALASRGAGQIEGGDT
jgi:hypothetical protein